MEQIGLGLGISTIATVINGGVRFILLQLIDAALTAIDRAEIDRILGNYETHGIQFHTLRTCLAGSRRFVSFHVLVPAIWTVKCGHDLCYVIELAIGEA